MWYTHIKYKNKKEKDMSQINWIKASLKGRLGEVVGSSWRGKPYTKVYTPPTDPQTTGQTDVRGIFAHVGHLAHLIYRAVLEPYTYPAPHDYTKYNRMMMINRSLYDDMVYDPAKVKIMQGPLLLSPLITADYAPTTGEVHMSWDATAAPDENKKDVAIAIVYAEETDIATVVITTRETGEAEMALARGLTAAKLHCYLVYASPDTTPHAERQVSETSYLTIS
jgi:hypothetical protein